MIRRIPEPESRRMLEGYIRRGGQGAVKTRGEKLSRTSIRYAHNLLRHYRVTRKCRREVRGSASCTFSDLSRPTTVTPRPNGIILSTSGPSTVTKHAIGSSPPRGVARSTNRLTRVAPTRQAPVSAASTERLPRISSVINFVPFAASLLAPTLTATTINKPQNEGRDAVRPVES